MIYISWVGVERREGEIPIFTTENRRDQRSTEELYAQTIVYV